jgi:hypothetical protein
MQWPETKRQAERVETNCSARSLSRSRCELSNQSCSPYGERVNVAANAKLTRVAN